MKENSEGCLAIARQDMRKGLGGHEKRGEA